MVYASLFIIFLFICASGSVLPIFYASLFEFFFFFVPVARFCQCSMLHEL